MERRAFWKTRRGIGAIIVGVAFAAEVAGFIPEGSVLETFNAAGAVLGAFVSTWGAIQAKAPLGIR